MLRRPAKRQQVIRPDRPGHPRTAASSAPAVPAEAETCALGSQASQGHRTCMQHSKHSGPRAPCGRACHQTERTSAQLAVGPGADHIRLSSRLQQVQLQLPAGPPHSSVSATAGLVQGGPDPPRLPVPPQCVLLWRRAAWLLCCRTGSEEPESMIDDQRPAASMGERI